MSARVRLGRRLLLEARERVPDGVGGFGTEWVARGTLWADVRLRSGFQDFIAAVARPRLRYRIIVRGAPVGSGARPRAEERLREGARVFDILTVTEFDPAGRYLEILAEEGVVT